MSEINVEARDRYYAEVSLKLSKAGFTPQPQEDGYLPIDWNGSRLCRLTTKDGVLYKDEDVERSGGREALDRLIDIARTTDEYMQCIESAKNRQAEGIVKYYVTSDVHGFYAPLRAILTKAGYFDDTEPHKLLIVGDLFDRGREAVVLQSFILNLLERDEVILIRGNHENLFEELVTVDQGLRYDHHLSNGTYSTALQLTGFDKHHAKISPLAFARAARETPYYTTILPAMIDYYETDSFIFTHGWIPCVKDEDGSLSYMDGWREASEQSWRQARWINGIDAVRMVSEDGKTIVCGYWHSSYGHSKYEGKGTEFGKEADFSPYIAPGIIALDACTAHSGIVNCIIVED